jgi:AcrR family transcriptional regulator
LTFRLSTPIFSDVHTAAEKPLRADARRNREAILAAAKAVFAKYGEGAQMDDIARRAKLGVGTLYRHFPTKDALIEALLADRFWQLVAFVEQHLHDEDPFDGLCQSLWRGAELAARDRGVSQLFAAHIAEATAAHEAQRELIRLTDELITRARAAGTLRADFEVADIPVMMCGVTQAMHMIDRHGEDRWKRHLRLLFDGMRTRSGLEPLPAPAG